jgi:hypothetical protein
MSNYPSEPEFEQAVNEITSTLAPFLAKHPEYERALEVAKVRLINEMVSFIVFLTLALLVIVDPRTCYSVPRYLGSG